MDKKNLIGGNLKKYRELNNLSQRDFIVKLSLLGLNLDQASLVRIENYKRKVYDYLNDIGNEKVLKIVEDYINSFINMD